MRALSREPARPCPWSRRRSAPGGWPWLVRSVLCRLLCRKIGLDVGQRGPQGKYRVSCVAGHVGWHAVHSNGCLLCEYQRSLVCSRLRAEKRATNGQGPDEHGRNSGLFVGTLHPWGGGSRPSCPPSEVKPQGSGFKGRSGSSCKGTKAESCGGLKHSPRHRV